MLLTNVITSSTPGHGRESNSQFYHCHALIAYVIVKSTIICSLSRKYTNIPTITQNKEQQKDRRTPMSIEGSETRHFKRYEEEFEDRQHNDQKIKDKRTTHTTIYKAIHIKLKIE